MRQDNPKFCKFLLLAGVYGIICMIYCITHEHSSSYGFRITLFYRRGDFYEEKSSCILPAGCDGTATFRNIKIVVDGKEVSTSAEPFIYNGTTYLPIRAVGEAVGKEVTWNAGTNTVYLGEVPESAKQPETPAAPAATGSLPVFTKFMVESEMYGEEEVSEVLAAVRSGKERRRPHLPALRVLPIMRRRKRSLSAYTSRISCQGFKPCGYGIPPA